MHPDLTLDEESRAAIAALDDSSRQQLGERWQRRAQAELETGIFFAQLATRVLRESRQPATMSLIARAVAEELQHAELCHGLAGHYLEREVDWPAPRSWPEPSIVGVAPALETALLVTSMCCINEALASAYLRACHREATVPVVRRVLHALLGDEIHHAQAGWAFLASLDSRARLAPWIPMLVDFNLGMWLERVAGEATQPAHGSLDAAALERELRACLDGVVLAGFRHLGLIV